MGFTILKLFAPWEIFHALLMSADFFKNFFQEYHVSVKQIGSRSGLTICKLVLAQL